MAKTVQDELKETREMLSAMIFEKRRLDHLLSEVPAITLQVQSLNCAIPAMEAKLRELEKRHAILNDERLQQLIKLQKAVQNGEQSREKD